MKALNRKTKETDINASLELYGSGKNSIDTGIGFFNHMLESFSKHSLIDLDIKCIGDLDVDYHHSVEDCGIVIGKLLNDSLYPAKNIERFGFSSIVMDEACVECSIDISNRAFLVFDIPLIDKIGINKVGSFDCELVEEFFKALTSNAALSMHIVYKRGKNSHHIIEACFKSFAIALRNALKINERITIPSTKGVV
ncbi:imidazoleglycerol-phosphate dehydratase HisB [Helicobacter sp. MIT 14-3879]|uniref:imidazoleglycerol-phosphate dehydratase HisB n=1 Tax=Helicobacter sp. MIT 14-3879 TaxID=2040649 RepID=UPI000E1ECEB3|nr:imidazoleglycerol-phosphate dehydratase HisB [Helicobacter sp. MIT 14-3879]RDU64718.1 imidazoleglycerol-phosphate dehydratase HisB [Helicobacter sp. MIT 14-3879]